MSQCRVVIPEVVRLPLSDGDFLDVKRALTAGEYFDLLMDLDARKSFAKILAYLVGWSLVGVEGQPLPYSLDMDETSRRDNVRALTVPIMREIVAAIDAHEAAEKRDHDAKKKTRALSLVSNPTSASAAP